MASPVSRGTSKNSAQMSADARRTRKWSGAAPRPCVTLPSTGLGADIEQRTDRGPVTIRVFRVHLPYLRFDACFATLPTEDGGRIEASAVRHGTWFGCGQRLRCTMKSKILAACDEFLAGRR